MTGFDLALILLTFFTLGALLGCAIGVVAFAIWSASHD